MFTNITKYYEYIMTNLLNKRSYKHLYYVTCYSTCLPSCL